MRSTLVAGVSDTKQFTVTPAHTVPRLIADAPEIAAMPEVLASGYLIGLVELACIRVLAPHLEDDELSLGVHFDLSHEAPNRLGDVLDISAGVAAVTGRTVAFDIVVTCDGTVVSRGKHTRAVVRESSFRTRLRS